MSGPNDTADNTPATVEIVYEAGSGALGWTGCCTAFPDLRVDATSIFQIDLKLAPLVTAALQARHGQALSIHAVPGGERPLADGRYLKLLRVEPTSTLCSMTRLRPD